MTLLACSGCSYARTEQPWVYPLVTALMLLVPALVFFGGMMWLRSVDRSSPAARPPP